MFRITLSAPWLALDFEHPLLCLGWTPYLGGSRIASSLLWREVRNEDLSADFEVAPWIARECTRLGHPDSPCFLTSRQIESYCEARATVEGITAQAVVTAGLGNAERVGSRRVAEPHIGTINAFVAVDQPLSLNARLEALSLMAEARTLAMLTHAPDLWPPRPTGTGTDCLSLGCLPEGAPLEFAGKHTALGEAIGAAALSAFSAAISAWQPPE